MRAAFFFICCMSAVASASEVEPLWSGSGPGVANMPVVLTPARLRQPQSQVPASVTVIDRELIEASGARELYQVLQLVPGMAAVKVDGNVPTVSYHGTLARDVRQMLVLVDGRAHYQPGLARVLWNDLPIAVEDVERIEVTRGPASAAYGANAFQGVINIITRHPSDVSGTTVATRTGNNGVRDWRVTSAQGTVGRSVRLTLAERSDHGYDDPGIGKRDEKRITKFNLRAVFEPDVEQSLEFLAGGTRSVLQRPPEYESTLEYMEMPDEHVEKAFLQLRWNRHFSPEHQLRVQAYAQHTDNDLQHSGCFLSPLGAAPATGAMWFSRELRDLFDANDRDFFQTLAELEARVDAAAAGDPVYERWQQLESPGPSFSPLPPLCAAIDFDIEETRYDLEIEETVLVGDRARVVVGGNLRHDQVDSAAWLNGKEVNFSRRIFGNLELRMTKQLRANIGGYWERDDLNGINFSGRGALIFSPKPGHSFRVVVAEALRTMDIYEERADIHLAPQRLNTPYADNAQALLGWENPEFVATQASDGSVVPEHIVSSELGYFGQFSAVEVDVRLFRERLRDLISDASNPTVFDLDNEASVDIDGGEVQVSWRPHPRHMLRATGAHIHTESDHPRASNRDRLLRLAPRESASLLWSWDMTRHWDFSAAGYLVHDYNEFEYERADARIRWRAPVSAGSTLELGAVVQYDLVDDPVLFDDNLYRDDRRYWLSAALTFQ